MRGDLLQLNERRVSGRIYLRNKMLKESAPSENPDCGEFPRKASHGLELLGDYNDFDLVEINWAFGIIKYAPEFLFYSIFDPFYPQ